MLGSKLWPLVTERYPKVVSLVKMTIAAATTTIHARLDQRVHQALRAPTANRRIQSDPKEHRVFKVNQFECRRCRNNPAENVHRATKVNMARRVWPARPDQKAPTVDPAMLAKLEVPVPPDPLDQQAKKRATVILAPKERPAMMLKMARKALLVRLEKLEMLVPLEPRATKVRVVVQAKMEDPDLPDLRANQVMMAETEFQVPKVKVARVDQMPNIANAQANRRARARNCKLNNDLFSYETVFVLNCFVLDLW